LFTFLLQLRETLQHGHPLHLFTIFVGTVWILWAVKILVSCRYRPRTAPYRLPASVVVPVVDEPLELFRELLRRIGEQAPDETIVVINGPALEEVCNEFAGQLTWTWTPVASKRNAVRIGVEMASGEVVVLLDSDTIWTEGTVAELLKPFADPPRGRRDHQAAHPRPRAQPAHPVGGLAEEQGPAEPSRPAGLATIGDQARTYDPNHEPARPAM
jgi:hyaluronan synthase